MVKIGVHLRTLSQNWGTAFLDHPVCIIPRNLYGVRKPTLAMRV